MDQFNRTEVRWSIGGTGTSYKIDGAGDPLDDEGAKITLRSVGGDTKKFGAAITSIDASPFRLHSVTLSAVLSAQDATGGAGLWLRADGPSEKLAFANSEGSLVRGSSRAEPREIGIDVPEDAKTLVFGAMLFGNGEAIVERLRLTLGPAISNRPELPAATEFDAAVQIVRDHALHAGDIDWTTAALKYREMIRVGKTSADAYQAIRAMLADLGDNHSFLQDPNRARAMANSGKPSADPVIIAKPGAVGYIAMPGYWGTDPKASHAFVSGIGSAIQEIASETRCGWIVDLRDDIGGNMNPVLAALKPFLGTADLGHFKSTTGLSQPLRADANPALASPIGPDLSDTPVAIITGPRTASSGEIVAIAFRGRPKTRSFGEPTAGQSTFNEGFALPDGAVIWLTTAVDVDRDGHEYGGKVEPDQVVISGDGEEDIPVLAASSWLQQASGCSP